ncbi:MAG: hypothetical protein Q8P12_00265, partial [bacterium]|nr:hypothetical protein [bacterium]
MAKLLLDKRKLTALALAALLLVTSATYAATTGGGTLPITSGSSLTSGGVAEITALNEAFTIVQGKTQKISGIEVCRADLGSTTIRDQIKWHVTLLNPQDMGQVLNNPNSWIQIEV